VISLARGPRLILFKKKSKFTHFLTQFQADRFYKVEM